MMNGFGRLCGYQVESERRSGWWLIFHDASKISEETKDSGRCCRWIYTCATPSVTGPRNCNLLSAFTRMFIAYDLDFGHVKLGFSFFLNESHVSLFGKDGTLRVKVSLSSGLQTLLFDLMDILPFSFEALTPKCHLIVSTTDS